MDDERIGRALRDAPVPDEAGAEERGLRVVRAAVGGEAPARPRPPRLRRLGLALLASALIFILVLTPVGAEVRDFVKDVVEDEEPDPARSLTRVPGGGELLVESDEGPWIVRADGSQRLLGDFEEATWSPHGLFVAVTDGGRLSAVDPLGNPRWTITRPAEITEPLWSPSGFRVAYRAGQQLRVVWGDGIGDRLLTRRAARPAAWRPGSAHVLAYASPAGVIRAIDTDTGELLLIARKAPGAPSGLEWSDDGSRLLVHMPDRIRVLDAGGRQTDLIRPRRPDGHFLEAAWEPGSHRIAYLEAYRNAGRLRTELALLGSDGPPRPLIEVPGFLVGVVWSPDGSRILTGWRGADQWFFVPVANRAPRSVADIRAQFSPGSDSGSFPSVAGWVQPAR